MRERRKMKEEMWEDMFTPEGVLMTSPHDAGMKGRNNGWHGKSKDMDTSEPKHDAMAPDSDR
jgi:hypothetical protein